MGPLWDHASRHHNHICHIHKTSQSRVDNSYHVGAEELITDASAMASIEVSLDHLSQLEANLRQLVPTEIESVGRTCATHESAWSQLGANKMIQSRSVKNSIGTTGHDLVGSEMALKLEKIQQLITTLRPT